MNMYTYCGPCIALADNPAHYFTTVKHTHTYTHTHIHTHKHFLYLLLSFYSPPQFYSLCPSFFFDSIKVIQTELHIFMAFTCILPVSTFCPFVWMSFFDSFVNVFHATWFRYARLTRISILVADMDSFALKVQQQYT